jgi:hypothetical protein
VTSQPAKRPVPVRTIPSSATVTVERVERLDDGSLMSYEIRGGEVRLIVQDNLLTAEGRRVLTELLTDILGHFRPAEQLRLVRGDG